jgi:hypothetical protein
LLRILFTGTCTGFTIAYLYCTARLGSAWLGSRKSKMILIAHCENPVPFSVLSEMLNPFEPKTGRFEIEEILHAVMLLTTIHWISRFA